MKDQKHTLKEFLDIAEKGFEAQSSRLSRWVSEQNLKDIEKAGSKALLDSDEAIKQAQDLLDRSRFHR